MSRPIAALLLVMLSAPVFAQSREFDAAWTSYFGPEFFLFIAVKNPSIDGPLMHRPLEADPGPNAGPAQFVRSLLEDAKKEKVIDANFAELVPDGFAVGFAPGADPKKGPAGLLVAAKNPHLMKFYDWVITHYQQRNGKDSTEPVKIEGFSGTRFLKNPKGPATMLIGETAILVSNEESAIARALKRNKEGRDSIAGAKFYKRARNRVNGDAAMFVMADPVPFITLAEQSVTGPNRDDQIKKLEDARKNFEAVDAVLLALSAEKSASRVDFSVLLDPSSAAFKNFKALAVKSGVKAGGFAGADTPLLLALIRPGDITGAVAPGYRENFANELMKYKGELQAILGLDYDADVAPWWGSEIALMLALPENATPQGALLFEARDAKAAQAACDKVAKFIQVSQNRMFQEMKVGDASFQVAGPPPGLPPGTPSPLNHTLGLAGGFAILASGPDIVQAALDAKAKLAGTPAFTRLATAVPAKNTGGLLYLKTDVLVKMQPGAPTPGSPALKMKQLADDVDSIAATCGWPDEESVRVTVLFNGH